MIRRSSTRPQRIAEALERVGLTAAAKKKYRAYSLGMRQRLGLAWALLRPCQLLVLDEPTNGMDPQGTREIRHLIRQLAAEGATVFLSSHLLSEIEQVCSHVGIMNRGKLLMQGTLDDLKASASPKLRVEADDPVRAAEVLARMGMADVAVQGPQLVGSLDGLLPEDCCRSLVEAGVAVRMLLREQLSLEDAFVALNGGRLQCGWLKPGHCSVGPDQSLAWCTGGRTCVPGAGYIPVGGAGQRERPGVRRPRHPERRFYGSVGVDRVDAVFHPARRLRGGRRFHCRRGQVSAPSAICSSGRPAGGGCWWRKVLVLGLFCVVAALVIVIVGLIAGVAFFPHGVVVTFSGTTISFVDGIGRQPARRHSRGSLDVRVGSDRAFRFDPHRRPHGGDGCDARER